MIHKKVNKKLIVFKNGLWGELVWDNNRSLQIQMGTHLLNVCVYMCTTFLQTNVYP